MTVRRRQRGEPLIMLGAIMCGWVGVRAALWEPPYSQAPYSQANASIIGEAELKSMRAQAAPVARHPARHTFSELLAATVREQGPLATGVNYVTDAVPAPADRMLPALAEGPSLVPQPALAETHFGAGAHPSPAPVHPLSLAATHQLMWMAAVSAIPATWQEGAPPPAGQSVDAPPALTPRQREMLSVMFPPSVTASAGSQSGNGAQARRWSGDGWLLARGGGEASASGAALPTYGASQYGAVLRYRLDPAGGHQFSLYARAASAMASLPGGSQDKDAALGLSARPLPWLPVMLAAEARVSQFEDGTTHLRPAIMGVSQLAPMQLPLGLRADLYAAGGYVGGAAATAFAEGQLHVDRQVAALGPASLRMGAGAWGGAQQGVSRLDVGPSVSVAVTGGHTAARVVVDWRFRVAGDAAPPSGPAVTLAAGF